MKQPKILHFLLALLIAFGIWVYVVTVVSPESEDTFYNIPVVLTNESVLLDKGLMIESDGQPTVTLKLRGNRTDLINLKNSDIMAVADLSRIHAPGEQTLNVNITFRGDANGNAYEIVEQTPSYITLQIAEWSTKEIPINVLCDSSNLKDNYIAFKDTIVQDYETVTITGPKSVVDRIAEARVDIALTPDHTETLNQSFRYTLVDSAGQPVDAAAIKTNVAEVNVTVRIQQVKELQLVLNVTYGGGATPENTTIVLSQQAIKVSGNDKLLATLDSLTIGSINLAEMPESTQLNFPVTLPEGIENLSGITSVDVNITFNDLVIRTLDVERILVAALPEGMAYEIGTKRISVTFRGPADLVETMTVEHISALIDLTGAALGEELYKAQILLDENYKSVGVIGNYSVLVTLTEATEEPDGAES